jgi:diguanylate cyclase (GGDEF)-like protein/PAS domain S-box-containing protein
MGPGPRTRGPVVAAEAQGELTLHPDSERFAAAFRGAPVGMALVDTQGDWTEVNEALCRITGRTAEELRTTALGPIVQPGAISSEHTARRRLLSGEIPSFQVERCFRHTGGDEVSALLTVSVVRDRVGAPRFTVLLVQDISERKAHEAHHDHLLDHDFLTGLFTRRRFAHELAQQVARAARYGPRGAVLLLDLDHFKRVNDTLGHEAGDELLKTVAGALRRRIRRTDVLARLGGDEFALLLPKANLEEATRVAEALVDAVRGCGLPRGATCAPMTVSVGIALFDSLHEKELVDHADRAMYRAKQAGRDRVAVHTTASTS